MSVDDDFIAPLQAFGWPRRKGVSAAAQKAGYVLMRDRLAYLDAAELSELLGQVEAVAMRGRVEPSAGEILALADQLRASPVMAERRAAAVRSMMRSAAGQAALKRGHAVEMLDHVSRLGHGFAVSEFLHSRWAAAAEDRLRDMRLMRERVAQGCDLSAQQLALFEAREAQAAKAVSGGEA